jgi:hypothetical protein
LEENSSNADRKKASGWLVPVVSSAIAMFSVWAVSPFLFAAPEPWDSPYPAYSVSSALLGFLVGVTFQRNIPACFMGAWAGQVIALATLPGLDRGWLLLGVFTTGAGSLVFVLGVLVGSLLRSRSDA